MRHRGTARHFIFNRLYFWFNNYRILWFGSVFCTYPIAGCIFIMIDLRYLQIKHDNVQGWRCQVQAVFRNIWLQFFVSLLIFNIESLAFAKVNIFFDLWGTSIFFNAWNKFQLDMLQGSGHCTKNEVFH